MAKTQRFKRNSPQARSHSTRTEKRGVLKRNRDDSDNRRVPYTFRNPKHVYRNSPDPHRRRPGRNQQRSTTDTANFTRRQRTGGFGQHSGGFGQHSVQQQWRPTRGHRPFGRGKLSFRGKRPVQGQQQTVRGQQFTPRGGWQGRGHRRRRWLPREQTRFMAHSDTTNLGSSNTGAHGLDRAGHGIDQASRSNLRVDRISRSSSRVNQVSRSSSQISQSSLPDIVGDKQGTTSTLEQLINEAVDSISDLDTPPGSVGSVDTSDSSADDPEASNSVQKRKKKKSKIRLTRSGKPSRWDVPPPPSPCSDQEKTNTSPCSDQEETNTAATQQAEGHHVQDRLLGLSGSLEKNDPQHAINQLTEKLRSLTSALPAPSEDALAALAPLPSPEIVASSSASITTSPKKVPQPVQVKKKKRRNQTPVNQKYQLTENLRSLTSALPVPSNDALAALAPLPSPEIATSSSASITTSPKKVPQPVQVKEKKENKQNLVNVSHESFSARWQAVDLPAAHSSRRHFRGSDTAGNLWQPHILGKMIQQIHNKTPRRKPQAKMAEKPVRYDPAQILATVEPEPGKSVSTKRTVRLKAKPARSGKIPDKEELKVKPQSGVPESEPRRLVKIKTPQTSIRAVHDQDTRGCEKSASRVEEKALNELAQTSPLKQNPNSSSYQGDPQEMPRHSRQPERPKDEDALADSFAHASIQPIRDFDFSQFFQHSRSEEQCFIDSLAQKCSEIKLDKSTIMNLNSEAGDAGRTQREEDALAGSTSSATTDRWHQRLEENTSLTDHQQVSAGLDPYQAAHIPADAGLWNQGAHQTNPVTTNAVYNSGDAATWQHGTPQTDSMTTNAAFIPGNAGVWQQGAHQTGPVTQVPANIDPNQAAYIPGNAGLWNQGATQTDPVTSNSAYIPANQGAHQTSSVTQVSMSQDPYQAAYIPGNAGLWNQGARQTHPVTSHSAYIPANQGAHQTSSVTQVSMSRDIYQAAYIPGNAGLWNQGATQTDPVTSHAAYIPANQGAHQKSSVTQVSTSQDPYQAAYIPGNAGVWNQGATQTDPVTSNSAYIPANQGAHQTSSVTQVSMSQDPYQAAYIPGNAGVWNQGATQTDPVTSNSAYIPANQGAHQKSSVTQVSMSQDPYQAAYIPGNAGVWNQGATQTDPVTSNSAYIPANQGAHQTSSVTQDQFQAANTPGYIGVWQQDAHQTDSVTSNVGQFSANKDTATCQGDGKITGERRLTEAKTTQAVTPTEVKTTQSVPLSQVKTTHPVPSGLGPSKTTPRPEGTGGTGISTQARPRVPAVKKARKGSVTNMNERDKLKALFSVRKKPALTRMDSSDTQPFKSPSKSIKGDPFSSAVQTSHVGKDVSMSCIFTVSKTTDARSDAEKSFSQSVPNPKKALPKGKGVAKPMFHTVTSRQAPSASVPSVAHGMLDDMDQSGDHEKYIDDDDILREIDSCLASPKSRIKNDTREKAEVQRESVSTEPLRMIATSGADRPTHGNTTQVTRKDLASCRPMNPSHPSDDTVTASVDVAADGTRKTNTPKAAVTSTAGPSTEVLETTKHSTSRSKDFIVKSSEDDPLQSTIVVEQDPSGTTEINISVAITADDDTGKNQVRAGGDASLHVEGTSSRLVLPATGQVNDTATDAADDSEYVTTCFNLCLPRKQSLEIHLKPMLQAADDLDDNIEVEVSTEAGSVTHTASNLLAKTHVSRSVICSERTISVVVDNNGDSEGCSHLDEACIIKEADLTEIADIPEQLPVERDSASNEHADTDITEENTMTGDPDACTDKADEGSKGREQNRTLQKSCTVGADEFDETESSTVDGAQEGNLEDSSNKKVQILRKISQEEETLAQSQTKDAAGFPTGESSLGDSQENETVRVPPGALNKELDNPAELQETLAEENSQDVPTASDSSRVQPSGVTDGSCMETEKGESNDVHTDLHSSQEQPDGESFMDTDLEVSVLCGSAAGKPESDSPTSPPCLLQWDECVAGAAGVCASPPHLEPQASLSTSTSPSVSPTCLSQPAVLDLNGNSVPERKQCSGGCAYGRSSSASSCVCNQTKQTLSVVEPSLPNLSTHQALSPDRLSCVFGERDARALCGESVDGGGGHMGVGLVSVMSKHPEVQQKSFSHVDLFPAPAAMSGTMTNASPAETLELEDSFSENRSPVSDDSDDSLSDGPDFGSSVIRSPIPLSAVNTNVSSQGGRSLPAWKQTHTASSDERPTFSLDSLLSDTKNDEAEEHEIRVMQSELKRDLISSKGIGIAAEEEDDDTEEADDENFTDEQKDTLLRLQLEEGQIREIHPGEAVLSNHLSGQLFTNNLLPTDCGVVTSSTHNPLSQLLTNYQPEMLMDILSSDIISLAYGSLPCKEQVQRWLLFLLSCHSNATVVQKCGDQLLQVLQWQMEDIVEGNDKHTWAPRILDILRILVNWGANKDDLVFDTAAVDAAQLGEVVPLHDNGGLPPVSQRNVESVLKVLSCLLQARPPYSTEELNQLLVMVCKVSLDQSLLRECLLSDLQVCMASILDCYEASKWHTAVPWLCRVLGGLSSHHHNQVYVTQLFSPTSLRGGYIQQRLAFFFLHNAVNHCIPTDLQLRDFQIQDLCELISGLRPLLQSDNYQLSSLIQLLALSVGPAVQHITQRKLLCRLLESVRLIVSEIRDSVQQLDSTKAKGMLLHLCLKWDLSVKASNTKQRKIFNSLLSRPVLVEKLEDRGQTCNEEEGTDDLGFPLSDDEGESEGGGGKRLKTDGELTQR